MKTLLLIIAMTTVCAGLFTVGYSVAMDKYKYYDENAWEETMDKVKKFCIDHPNFIELPTGEIVILRYYPVDYVFMFEEEIPIDVTQLDTISWIKELK